MGKKFNITYSKSLSGKQMFKTEYSVPAGPVKSSEVILMFSCYESYISCIMQLKHVYFITVWSDTSLSFFRGYIQLSACFKRLL